MENIRQLVESVLENGFLLSLGTVDPSGIWVSDVIYVHDASLNIYWLSHVEARHSKAIMVNPKVAGTITISNNPGALNIGLQIDGIAEKVEGDILEIATKHRVKRGKAPPSKEGEILDSGESWYRLKPTKIELIHEPLFGSEKKVLKIQ